MRFFCCAIGLLLLLPVFGMQVIVDNFPYTDSATLEKVGLHGPVKTMRTYLQKGGRPVDDLTFDPNGRLLVEMYYHPNTGKLLWKHYYKYDAIGRLVKATSVGEYVKETGATFTFTYDDQGNKTGETSQKEDGSVLRRSTFTYDEHGHLLIRSDIYSDAQTVGWREEHRYDANGNQIAWQFGAPKDTRTWTTTYTYFPNGKIQRQEMGYGPGSHGAKEFSPEGRLIEELFVPLVTPQYRTGDYEQKRYTYTDAGNMKEETWYDEKDRLISRVEHDYNADGQETERRSFNALPNQQELTLWQERHFRYNAKGWKGEETILSYRSDGQSFDGLTSRWTYDAYGNAIDNPRPYGGMGIWMAYREFTYYEQ